MRGWLAHGSAQVTRLLVTIDALPVVVLPHGLAREGIGNTFSALPDRNDLAFVGQIALPVDYPAPVLLKDFAELDNGERHLVFTRRAHFGQITRPSLPAPPSSPINQCRSPGLRPHPARPPTSPLPQPTIRWGATSRSISKSDARRWPWCRPPAYWAIHTSNRSSICRAAMVAWRAGCARHIRRRGSRSATRRSQG